MPSVDPAENRANGQCGRVLTEVTDLADACMKSVAAVRGGGEEGGELRDGNEISEGVDGLRRRRATRRRTMLTRRKGRRRRRTENGVGRVNGARHEEGHAE